MIAHRSALAGAGATLLDLVLPRACVACTRLMDRTDAGIVCGRCWARLHLLPEPQCARCGYPAGVHRCRWCDLLPPYVRAVRSVCWMAGGTAASIVHALKYDGWERVAIGMGERMARLAWPEDVMLERAALVPVPLAAARRRKRGYNQSELLADALGAQLGLPVWRECLTRSRSTQSQTRLTPGERLANVAGAFHAVDRARARIRGAHVIIVDDVVTTAATLNACAAALMGGGARITSYVTFGRARA